MVNTPRNLFSPDSWGDTLFVQNISGQRHIRPCLVDSILVLPKSTMLGFKVIAKQVTVGFMFETLQGACRIRSGGESPSQFPKACRG